MRETANTVNGNHRRATPSSLLLVFTVAWVVDW
jgi:hypothetical protein